jgi:hypothetical protein
MILRFLVFAGLLILARFAFAQVDDEVPSPQWK